MKRLLTILFVVSLTAGCASSSYRFQNLPPVTELGDKIPGPLPEKTGFNTREYLTGSAVRIPLVEAMDLRRTERSQDVNSMDEVPSSTWFTPRAGYQNISPAQLVRGPESKGAPQTPVTVLKAKTEGSAAGLMIKDSRGYKYLIKFDSPVYPGLESLTNYVVNRLFWGFGYNVPEDYLFRFNREDLKIDSGSKITEEELNDILWEASLEEDGRYRSTASLFIQGDILGHVSQLGTREGDVNDNIAHENLRALRALYMLCAWTNNVGIRSDNTLDTYVGEAGQGHTVHYMLDFGEAFGVHGLNYRRRWEGHEHFFSWKETAVNAAGLGLPVHDWEKVETSRDDPVSYFRSDSFDPATWKESSQFQPIRQSRPEDDYWAAKILASFGREHLDALFEQVTYSEPSFLEYLKETLMERKDKLLNYALFRVTPLDASGISGNQLQLRDQARSILNLNQEAVYKVHFYNEGRKAMAPASTIRESSNSFQITVPEEVLSRANGYLRIELSASYGGRAFTPPAEFHISQNDSGDPVLVGVVH